MMDIINNIPAVGCGSGEYSLWLGRLTTMKAAGVDYEHARIWCEKAPGGELTKEKWEAIPEGKETKNEARKILFNLAKKSGYNGTSTPKNPIKWEVEKEKKAVNCQRLLSLMYSPEDIIYICNGRFNEKTNKIIPDGGSIVGVEVKTITEEVLSGFLQFDRGMYVQYNTVDAAALEARQKEKPNSSITRNMITSYRYAYIECDPEPGEDFKEFIKASQMKLEELDLPWIAHVFSGNKSIHTVIRLDAETEEQYSDRIKKIHEYCRANGYNVDPAVKDVSRWGRFPCCKRGNLYQCIMAINDNIQSFAEWEAKHSINSIEADFYGTDKKISMLKIKKYCENLGFRSWFDGERTTIVKVEGKFVKQVEKNTVINAVNSSILAQYGEDKAEPVFRCVAKLTDGFFASLEKIEIENHTDTVDTVFLYFKNCFVEIQKNKITTHQYSEMNGYLWGGEVQSMNYNYNPANVNDNSDWNQFLLRCFSANPEKQKSIRQTIGYLLSRYKNIAYPKAIILADAQADSGEDAISSGGTGKNLFLSAINFYRKAGTIDCKKIAADSQRFIYSAFSRGQSLYELNDIKHNFSLDSLYNELTGDLEIEYKGKNKLTIPFEESPKFVITSNFIPKGNCHGSTMRRFIIQEIENYYSYKLTPVMEFGRRFFVDWGEEDWEQFHAFNISCIQEFLQSGSILEISSDNLEMKKIKAELGNSLFEFFENYVENNKGDFSGGAIRVQEIYNEYKTWADMQKIPVTYRALKYGFKDKMKLYFRGGITDLTDYQNKKPVTFSIQLSNCILYKGEEAPF